MNVGFVEDCIFVLKYVIFELGFVVFIEFLKKYELVNVVEVMNEYFELVIGLGGYIDNIGDVEVNMLLL